MAEDDLEVMQADGVITGREFVAVRDVALLIHIGGVVVTGHGASDVPPQRTVAPFGP